MRHIFRRAMAIAAALFLAGGLTAGAAADTDSASTGRTLSGPINVGFADGALPEVGDTLAGLAVVDTIPALGVASLDAPLGIAVGLLEALPGVTYVEPDVRLRSLAVPDDNRYGEQYGPAMMGLPAAWDAVGFGSSDVTVAVLDTGLRSTHEDFQAARLRQGYDYANNDGTPNDDCGHGTHVAGTVGATTGNGKGVAGVSQATILPMKVLSPIGLFVNVTCSGSTSDIAEAIVDATDQGAGVISMSLGGGGSTTLRNAVDHAWNNGVLVVAAAGNDGGNNSVDFPAAYDNAIAVGALDASKSRASYSDGGPQLDIAAPGSSVLSTYNSSNTSYSSLSGTSMATPHVAGVLALALGCAPEGTTAVQVRDALYSTAEDLGAAGRDDAYGHGLARADHLVAELCDGSAPPPDPDPDPDPDPEPDPDPDPDPATPTLTPGQPVTVTVDAQHVDSWFKVAVPAGATRLEVTMDGPSCGLLSCSLDADLSTRADARPTNTQYECRPYQSGSDESCVHSAPASSTGYWYLRVNRYSGSGSVTLTAAVS